MDRQITAEHDVAVPEAAPQRLALASDLPATAHLTLVSSVAGLQALETGWRQLETSAYTTVSAFQCFDWVSAWSTVYAQTNSKIEIHVLAGYDDGRLVFVWPLMLHRVSGVRVLSWLTEPFGQYGDVICANSHCPRLWVANGLRFLRRMKGFDLLRLRHVRADSTLATIAGHELVDAKLNERAPWLDLTAFKTEQEYDDRYTSAQRKRRKKIRKHLEDMGPVTFRQLPPGTEADAAIRLALLEKNKWLKERGRMNRVINDPDHQRFLRLLSQYKPQGLAVIVTELKAGDRPISWEIGFRTDGQHFAYITSHVNALTDLSPGRLHMDLSQRACLAAGMNTFDLMVPYDAHKESWSSACMDTKDFFLPFTARGFVAGHVYLRLVRPIIRSIYYRLPAHILRLASSSGSLRGLA